MTSSYTDCRELFAALSEYLDADLPPADCAAIEAHIAGCGPCVEFVDSLKKSIALCHGTEPTQQPPPLSDDVRAQLLAAYREALAKKS